MRIFIVLLFSIKLLAAQKVVKKSIIAPEITAINIDVNNCFELSLRTTDSEEMVLEAAIDGEYKKDLVLNTEQEGNTILVSSGFQPIFKNPNDKLSAHKVISVALEITLPEYKSVTVYGTNCNVAVLGRYRNLKVTLDDGTCRINQVSESVEVNTQSGDIIVHAEKAKIEASSRYGNIERDTIAIGNDEYNVTTVTGEIRINKTD